jgi:ABC-2 type transport system permease protein
MYAVFRKELADHLASRRFLILFILVLLASVFATYIAIQNIRGEVTTTTEFIFLKIFTLSGGTSLSFLFFMSLFIPIMSIALGFDAVNSERTSGNLSRLLSQPIYRDSVINGKFLAALAILAIIIVSVIAIVAGLGLRIVGVPPGSEEVLRLIFFTLVSIIYGAFWLALAVLFSVLFKSSTTSILASIGLWLFLFVFMGVIASAIAGSVVPLAEDSTMEMIARHYEISGAISRISPSTLYGEATYALLTPEQASFNPALILWSAFTGRMESSLSFGQSLLLAWPQIVGIIALAAICFAISYTVFMREEIRSI